MKRSEKKGFTIVELVIVIAVIAILAAVLIPNLSKLMTNANETADTMLIKELNTALDLDLERHETMYDALVAVERAGFIVSRINASVAGNEILWDSVNDCFVYLKGNEIVYQANREETPVDRSKKYLYWRIYESLPTEQTYSIYLNNETYNAETSVTVGFDAGRNKNAFAVNYRGTGTAQKVILRTDGQNLTVNAGQDTVNHYGATRTLTVTAVATNDCYHEHGFVGTLASFGNGKLVAYRGAKYHQTRVEVEAVIGENAKDLEKAFFEQHYYQDGKCIVTGCPMIDHDHTYVEQSVSEATCTETGERISKCSICGDMETEVLAVLGHNWNEGEVTTEATCGTAGVKTFTCSRCNGTKTEDIPATGEHDWNEWAQTATEHSHTCKNCSATQSATHDTTGDGGKCSVCGYSAVKNGLVDGYYYRDNELFTGTTEDGYTFRDGVLVLSSESSKLNMSSYYKITHSFSKSSIDSQYLTDKVILITNSSVYCVPGSQSGIRNYLNIDFTGYTMSNAKAFSPNLREGLLSTPWTVDTITQYMRMVSETCGNEEYTDANAFPFYVQGKDYEDYKSLNISTISFSEYLKLKYRNNTIVTSETSAIMAYFVKSGTTEKISAYAYRNEDQGIGLVIGSDGKVYGYVWSENASGYDGYTEIKADSTTNKFINSTKYSVVNNGTRYIVKYDGVEIVTLDLTTSEITDYNLGVEKENLKGTSIYNECTPEELLAIATMPGNTSEIRIMDDPEVVELFIKAFWKQYWLKIVDSAAEKTYSFSLEGITKESLSSTKFYYGNL